MVTWLIVSIVIILLLILGVVIMILVGIRKRGAKQGNTPTLETPAVHPPGTNYKYDLCMILIYDTARTQVYTHKYLKHLVQSCESSKIAYTIFACTFNSCRPQLVAAGYWKYYTYCFLGNYAYTT